MSKDPTNSSPITSANTIPELVEHLINKFHVNAIPNARSNRLDLERHYGRCEIIQYIINHCELSTRDFNVSPIDTNSDTKKDTNTEPLDPIAEMLQDEGYLTTDDEMTFN